MRKELVDSGIVKDWVFTQDVLFKSAARASKCITGYSVNANEGWRALIKRTEPIEENIWMTK